MSESDIEAPTADALEQRQVAAAGADEPVDDGEPGEVPLEVNEADAAEQQRTVELGDDDYN